MIEMVPSLNDYIVGKALLINVLFFFFNKNIYTPVDRKCGPSDTIEYL